MVYVLSPHAGVFMIEMLQLIHANENSVNYSVQLMAKQIHIRLEDTVFEALLSHSVLADETLQDVVSGALMQFLENRNKIAHSSGKYSFIDLFAGIGGMRLAFEGAGGQCLYSNEWDKYCQQTYFANFGEQPDGDITKVKADTIPDHDILVAGFPCQPFSIAGVSKKQSLGRSTGFKDQTQGTLFFDICRILDVKRPKAFMLENVKNLRSHDKGNTFKIILESLKELNYQVFFKVLDGQGFVPQHRERILIVGFDRNRYKSVVDFSFKIKFPKKKPALKDILEAEVDSKYTLSDKLWSYLQDYAAKHRALGNGFGYGIADRRGISRTLSARYYKDGSEILIAQDNKNPRRLTPRECARLQGFPEDFKIVVSDTQAYKQFGNSVVVPLMSAVASLLMAKLKECDAICTDYQNEYD